MATILYRDGQSERVEYQHVDSCLKNGYFLNREDSLPKPKPKPKAKKVRAKNAD